MIKKDFDIKELDEAVKSGVVLIDFYATWCGPCKMLAPELEELAKRNNDITIYKIDVDENTEVARKYGVMSIPTLVLYKNGIIVDKTLGFRPVDELEKWIGSHK